MSDIKRIHGLQNLIYAAIGVVIFALFLLTANVFLNSPEVTFLVLTLAFIATLMTVTALMVDREMPNVLQDDSEEPNAGAE